MIVLQIISNWILKFLTLKEYLPDFFVCVKLPFSVFYIFYPFLFLFLFLVVIYFYPKRKTSKKTYICISSVALCITLLITTVFSGFKIQKDNVISDENTLLLVDVSDSSSNSKYKIDNYVESILENYDYDKNVGIIVFGNECEYTKSTSSNSKPTLSYNFLSNFLTQSNVSFNTSI